MGTKRQVCEKHRAEAKVYGYEKDILGIPEDSTAKLFRLNHNSRRKCFSQTAGYFGGAGRSRTALEGFAILCITALLPRRLN